MIGFLLFGLFVGVVARLLAPGRQHLGILMTLLLGVVGSLIGGAVASALGTGDIWELNFVGTVVGVIAAVLLIALAESVGVGSDRSRPARR